MKILYTNGGATPIKDLAIDKIKKLGHDIVFYNPFSDREEAFRWNTKHFQMYQKILEEAEKGNFDILYFSTSVSMPEYLFFELKVRPNFKPKIIFHLMLRGLNRSLARSAALKLLIDMPQVQRVVANTMIVDGIQFPDNMTKIGTNFNKIKLISESFNSESEDLNYFNINEEKCRKLFKIKQDDFAILLSGTWVYTKGVDIFIEMLKYLQKDIKVIIHRHKYGFDSTLDSQLIEKANHYHPNVTIIDKWLDNKEYPMLFRAVDLVVCAHRKSYEYGESGIPGVACKAKKLIVVPDFYFFNEIIRRHKVGVVYAPENPVEMAKAIHYSLGNYNELWTNAKFEAVTKNYGEISDIPVKALENL